MKWHLSVPFPDLQQQCRQNVSPSFLSDSAPANRGNLLFMKTFEQQVQEKETEDKIAPVTKHYVRCMT
jgi:hypothetical protein